ncbi:MAG: hypothetical protein ACFFB3_05160, partial [Candidatus Hodarchaeota archaeon]
KENRRVRVIFDYWKDASIRGGKSPILLAIVYQGEAIASAFPRIQSLIDETIMSVKQSNVPDVRKIWDALNVHRLVAFSTVDELLERFSQHSQNATIYFLNGAVLRSSGNTPRITESITDIVLNVESGILTPWKDREGKFYHVFWSGPFLIVFEPPLLYYELLTLILKGLQKVIDQLWVVSQKDVVGELVTLCCHLRYAPEEIEDYLARLQSLAELKLRQAAAGKALPINRNVDIFLRLKWLSSQLLDMPPAFYEHFLREIVLKWNEDLREGALAAAGYLLGDEAFHQHSNSKNPLHSATNALSALISATIEDGVLKVEIPSLIHQHEWNFVDGFLKGFLSKSNILLSERPNLYTVERRKRDYFILT